MPGRGWPRPWPRAATRRYRGHPHTASWAFLATAEYYAKALVSVDGLTDQSVLLPTFRKHRGCWEKVVDASRGRFVRVQVPCEDTTLPGLPAPGGRHRRGPADADGDQRQRRVAARAARLWRGRGPGRGWKAFLFDGPGQQSMLFERGVPFRPDWQTVLMPVIDALVARPDVVASALTGYGISQGSPGRSRSSAA